VLEKYKAVPATQVGGERFEDMVVEELRELTVKLELKEADLIDLLNDANSNADADEDDLENKGPSATTSFNSKAIGEHWLQNSKLFFGKRSITRK
jgi:hypothetical protein